MARSVTAYVSFYQPTRCHVTNFVRGNVFTLGANFVACLNGETITEATWRTDNTSATSFGSADIDGGLVTIVCTAGCGMARVKCSATLSDGSVVSQLFKIGVQSSPWYSGESVGASGEASVTVTP